MARGYGEGSICRRRVRRRLRDGTIREYVYFRAIKPAGTSGRRAEFQATDRKKVVAWLAGERSRVEASVSLGTYAYQWLQRHDVRSTTHDFYRYALLRCEPIDRLPVNAVTARHVRDLISSMAQRGLGSRTIRSTIQALALVLRDAQADGIVEQNVASLVKLPKLPPRRRTHYTLPQARQIIAFGQSDPVASLYVVALGTGLRRGELLNLTWGDVDFKNRHLTVTRSKTDAGVRTVPLVDFVIDTLRSLERSPGPIWPYTASYVTHDFADFCGRAGVPVLRLHDLRRTWFTLMAEVADEEIRQWLGGHEDVKMTRRYSDESERLMREAMDRFGSLVA